jgi:hypothetical protein
MGITIITEINGCSECDEYYLYTCEGSFCKHPRIIELLKGKNGLISNGFVEKGFPAWCPIKPENKNVDLEKYKEK